jgi:myo-inositol-1(or 4)-monophosphatase
MYYADGCGCEGIDRHLALGHSLVVNTHGWTTDEREFAVSRYKNSQDVTFVEFNPLSSDELLQVILRGGVGFCAIICSPNNNGLTTGLLTQVLGAECINKLQAICSPNDSVQHLSEVIEYANCNGIAVIHTPGVHARSVAEFTVIQIGLHARRLVHYLEVTGKMGAWPHKEAISSTRTLEGKTIGVIGGSGKDGSAVIELSLRFGMNVVATSSGSRSGHLRLSALGATVAPNLDVLLQFSDFISINCRKTKDTIGLIGSREIALMKPNTIIINPAGAEIIEKAALISEFSKPLNERKIAAIVLDMPYGGRRDDLAFTSDSDNARLKRDGVLFTPRMAGYTVDVQCRSVTELADYIDRYLRTNDGSVPVYNRGSLDRSEVRVQTPDVHAFMTDIISLVRLAGTVAITARAAGLVITYKPDGSPITNADLEAEGVIRDGLRSRGYDFVFIGEEFREPSPNPETVAIVVDAIDGTRNFRDGNYGWCVSVALSVCGSIVGAVVHDPETNATYHATKGNGAVLCTGNEARTCTVPKNLPEDFSFSIGSFRLAGSRVTKSHIADDIKKMGGRGREWGSVALSICAVARGGLGAFIQGNSYSHDHAAALLIAEEAGADVRLQPNDTSGQVDVIVSHPSISRRVFDIFDARVKVR